jgi:hypothetical protein
MVPPKDIIVHHYKFIFKCLEYSQNRYITLAICSGNEDIYGIKFFNSLEKKTKEFKPLKCQTSLCKDAKHVEA